MDIFEKINKLPYYLYVFEERAMVLGGQSTPPSEIPFDKIYALWKDIKMLYQKDDLSNEEKVLYAKNVQKMAKWSKRNTLTSDEIREKVCSLDETEQEDIKWQIEMYELGREMYRELV